MRHREQGREHGAWGREHGAGSMGHALQAIVPSPRDDGLGHGAQSGGLWSFASHHSLSLALRSNDYRIIPESKMFLVCKILKVNWLLHRLYSRELYQYHRFCAEICLLHILQPRPWLRLIFSRIGQA